MTPVKGELGRRSETMPRVQSAPEHNIVQNPAVTRGIQRFSGTRQAHVTPALAEGLHAVLSAGDIREDPRTGLPKSYAAFHEVVPDGVNVKRCVFGNPIDSDRVAVLRRLHVYLAEDFAAAAKAAGASYSIVYDLVGLGATLLGTINKGQRLVTGYQTVGSVTPPPFTGSDIIFGANGIVQAGTCGWKTVDVNGIAGGYIWRGIIGDQAGVEVLENFNVNAGPRMIVFPGGIFELYLIETTAHFYANMWWDEYNLT